MKKRKTNKTGAFTLYDFVYKKTFIYDLKISCHTMSGFWRKVENENGYPSYFNENTNSKQWDHPKFADVKQTIDECNFIKFSSYRVASKVRVLQRAFYMDEIPISMINGIFEKHRLGVNEASLHLESYDLEAILADIYFAGNKQNHTNTDIDFATELMQNFLYNVYDKERKGTLQVISAKVALGLLSSAKLSELYRYIYMLCADYNNTSPGTIGITERGFLTWLETGPQILSYIPTLYRMRAAESVIHNARCSVCKTTPLMGLRYRCMRCTRYTQCQKCFLSARTSNSHKVGHPMREYCTEKCSKEMSHAFIKRLCGILRCTLKLPTHPPDFIESRSLRTDKECLLKSTEANVECNITPLSCPQVQLQVVIRQLELQNRELQSQMAQLHGRNDKEMKRYLEEHRLHIATQIQKLKLLKDYLQNCQKFDLNPLESTPMIKNSRANARGTNLDMFSPIIQQPDFSPIPEGSSHDEWGQTENVFKNDTQETSAPYSIRDISTWIGERPATSSSSATGATASTYLATNVSGMQNETKGHVREMQHDLDAVLDKLQQILANNFSLDDSLSSADNDQLQEAVSEMEGMLTSLIDGVETSRATSALNSFPPDRETLLF
ncbi:Dystrophin [Carabus blaptoides fortunei]